MDPTNYVYSNDDQGREGPTKFGNFMTPRTGVVVLGRGYMSHTVNMHCLQSTLSICSTLIVVASVDFYLFYDEAVMQI